MQGHLAEESDEDTMSARSSRRSQRSIALRVKNLSEVVTIEDAHCQFRLYEPFSKYRILTFGSDRPIGGAIIIQVVMNAEEYRARIIVGLCSGLRWCCVLDANDCTQTNSGRELYNISTTNMFLRSISDRSAMVINNTTLVTVAIREAVREATDIDDRLFHPSSILKIDVVSSIKWNMWPMNEKGRFLEYSEILLEEGKLIRAAEKEDEGTTRLTEETALGRELWREIIEAREEALERQQRDKADILTERGYKRIKRR